MNLEDTDIVAIKEPCVCQKKKRSKPVPVSSFIEKVINEEMTAVPEPCREKGLYLCYILRSVVAPPRTYSGSTNDFLHRIRQHNGGLVGGAVATKTSRPWRVAALVYGFSCHAAALRYEWYTKCNHNKKAVRKGQNSLQRRAAMMISAELKLKPEERKLLHYHLPDYYFRRCVEEARTAGVPGTIDAIFAKTVCKAEGTQLAPAGAISSSLMTSAINASSSSHSCSSVS